MNNPHKPGRADETARITASNGWVTEERDLNIDRLRHMDLNNPFIRKRADEVKWVTVHRVCGELSVSRSIGRTVGGIVVARTVGVKMDGTGSAIS